VAHLKHVGEPQTAAQVAEALGVPERTESVYKLLEHLAANIGRGVDLIDGDDPATALFREVIHE
jgi:glucose-6-phosphate isomerase